MCGPKFCSMRIHTHLEEAQRKAEGQKAGRPGRDRALTGGRLR